MPFDKKALMASAQRRQKRMKWTNKFAEADKKRGVEIRNKMDKERRLKKAKAGKFGGGGKPGDGRIHLDPREMDGSLNRGGKPGNKRIIKPGTGFVPPKTGDGKTSLPTPVGGSKTAPIYKKPGGGYRPMPIKNPPSGRIIKPGTGFVPPDKKKEMHAAIGMPNKKAIMAKRQQETQFNAHKKKAAMNAAARRFSQVKKTV